MKKVVGEVLKGSGWLNARLAGLRAIQDDVDAVVVLNGQRLVLTYSTPGVRARVDDFAHREPLTIEWVKGFGKQDFFIDGGANIGLFTVLALEQGVRRVVAIEPSFLNVPTLSRNLSRSEFDDRAICLTTPISVEPGFQKFSQFAKHEGASAAALEGSSGDVAGKEPYYEILLRVESVDSICSQLGESVDHLKLDLDGGEFNALLGSKRELGSMKSLLVELERPGSDDYLRCRALIEESGLREVSSEWTSREKTRINVLFERP